MDSAPAFAVGLEKDGAGPAQCNAGGEENSNAGPGQARHADGRAQRPERRALYLHPGQLHASLEPTAVTTVLGSCVSVCLFDVGLQCGGMNHFLLPFWCGNSRSPGRFGNEATQVLLARLLALGGRHESIQAKVFGGACVIDALRRRHGQLGDQNVARALEALEAEGIPVVARDTDGERGRKLVFHTDTGDAWVKVL